MSRTVYVLVDAAGNARRCGLTLHEATRPQLKGEFTTAEWNSLWAAISPEQRVLVYNMKGWHMQALPVEQAP